MSTTRCTARVIVSLAVLAGACSNKQDGPNAGSGGASGTHVTNWSDEIASAGKELIEKSDDPNVQAHAFDTFDAACKAGVMEGCSQLGELYKYGLGRPADLAKSQVLYEQACTGHDPLGCSDLAVLYATGQGVTKDEAKAVGLYQQACDGALLIACTNLGFMFAKGLGTATDLDKAQTLYKRACDGNEPKGCVNLGAIYLRGNDRIVKDRGAALEYYKKACALGDKPSCDWVVEQK